MKYYFSKLNEEGREIYKKIYFSLQNFEEKIAVKGKMEFARDIYYMVINDNPMMFYVNPYQIAYYNIDKYVWIEPIYVYDKEKTEDIKAKINSILKPFEEKIKTMPSKLERERYIHRCLTSSIKYKYDHTPDDVECHTIVGSFINKEAVCDGISKAFKHLCNLAKINSNVILGDSWNEYEPKQSHAWNMVKIDNKWYYIDVTWNINLSERFKYIRYDYFNLRECDILRDHRNFEKLETCNSIENNFFYENNCIINGKRELDKFILDKFKNIKQNNGSKNIYFKLYCGEDEYARTLIRDAINTACLKTRYFFKNYTVESNDTQDVYLIRIN